MTPQDVFKAHGFPYPDNLIMAFIGGSTQHGAKLDDSKSDTDWYGVFIPPPEKLLATSKYESFVFPSNTEHRSRGIRDPFELDIALHSLPKWAGMAANGNPTVLSFLFSNLEFPKELYKAPDETFYDFDSWVEHIERNPNYFWTQIIENRPLFISKKSLWPFIHYGNDQLQRLMGLRGQKDVRRPILEELHGYDTKYAMHIVRLMAEAKELMTTGRLTYPRPEVELLKDIRRGKYKLNEIVEMSNELQKEAIAAQATADLPETVDRDKIDSLISKVILEFYVKS